MSEAPEDWQLLIGSWIELRRGDQLVRTGEVEAVTSDSSIMWLKFNGTHPRQLVAKTDGYAVYPVRDGLTEGN
ncbi:hypothetical protein [Arthrobacter sp. ISL-72]|uniref:hypothetical protein n=1 Tax=Arthrobacter sp. ISL-72 TaxID=2819114 RepID=UPI001BEA290B|nr:hypothetical protein [Arthrobacter sp. ISL-72]MBT2596703.1 hypothetical protein [Arthrobacter sp. ISL-72]